MSAPCSVPWTVPTTWPTRRSAPPVPGRADGPADPAGRRAGGRQDRGGARRWPRALDTPLIRLQCYEGLTSAEALYEWNYPRQLLGDPAGRGRGASTLRDVGPVQRGVPARTARCSPRSIIPGPRPAVLLIDEVDRGDDEFEAFLFELLAESAVTIPELGTRRAAFPPVVVLTSNRTRDLHDALKRRCLYHWIDYPDDRPGGRHHPPPGARRGRAARRAGRGRGAARLRDA